MNRINAFLIGLVVAIALVFFYNNYWSSATSAEVSVAPSSSSLSTTTPSVATPSRSEIDGTTQQQLYPSPEVENTMEKSDSNRSSF